MKKIIAIARYTFIENIRNKIFYVIILFGIVMIGASMMLVASWRRERDESAS